MSGFQRLAAGVSGIVLLALALALGGEVTGEVFARPAKAALAGLALVCVGLLTGSIAEDW